MRTIVSKFGGSSTANAGQLHKILGIIRASPDRRCVVLSAPGIDAAHREKVTALLEDCWRRRDDGERFEKAIRRVADRFRGIALEQGLPDPGELVRREVLKSVNTSLAHVLSRGEYLCAVLFSRYSGIPMIDAAEVIAFDENGDLDCERTRRSFEGLAARPVQFILPGFYGADPSGRICVFPRNGSDITGALAAAGLGAALYENWTDVPGLMTADPAVVPEARLIPLVGYRQMRALSRAGAQVLHPTCLDPVAMAGIPTRLRGTNSPRQFGTLIDDRVTTFTPCLAMKRGKVAEIAVFGIGEAQVGDAARDIGAISVETGHDRTTVRVDADAGNFALRALHRRLIENGA